MHTVKAQQKLSLLPIVENGKWGFIDKTGKIKVEPAFDQVGDFDDQLLVVKKNDLFYLLDSSGTIVFKEGFEDINIIDKEFVAVKNKGFALADKKGKLYSEFSYSLISRNKLHTISLKTDTTSFRLFNTYTYQLSKDQFSEVKIYPEEKYISVRKGDNVGILDSLHRYVLELVPGEKVFFEKGIPVVKIKGKYQIYSSNGKICGDTLYWKDYRILSDKFVEVWNAPSKKFILSQTTGRQFPFSKFQSCEVLGNSFLLVTNGNKKGLMNTDGAFVLPIEQDRIELAKDNTIRFFKNNKTGILSAEGKQIFSLQFDNVEEFNKDGIAFATKDNLWGIVSKTGKFLTPCKYDYIEITEASWKCYQNTSMDLYTLQNPSLVEEMIHFNEVGTVSINKKMQRNYGFSNRVETSGSSNNFIESKNGNYKLTSRAYEYSTKARIKCLIENNFLSVDRLYGVYSFISKRKIAYEEYWDIQFNELEEQEYARVIMSGDRQALLGRKGNLKKAFPVSKNGKEVLSPITYIGPFVNGLARVNIGGAFVKGSDLKDIDRNTFSHHSLSCRGGVWGYINGDGIVSIKIDMEYASDFVKGRAIVKRNGKYGVIDTLNEYIVKPEYDFISYLENSNKSYFTLIKNTVENGLLNDKGKVLIKAQYTNMHEPSENRVSVRDKNLWGVCDFSGAVVVPFKYEYIGSFKEGKAPFREKMKWGFIDSMGAVKIEPMYSEQLNFSNGYAAVKIKDKWGFINDAGKIVIPALYNKANSFQDGVASVYLRKKWWFIDTKGKKISRHWVTKISSFNQDGLAIVRKKKAYYVLRKSDGKFLTKGKYKSISPYSEGLACVKNKKNKTGFIDTQGKLVIPAIYLGAGDFSEGLARVRYPNKKWGYIDKKNKPKIAPEFSRAENFSEGRATVILEKKTMVIDSFGIRLFELPETKLGKYKEGMLLINGIYYNQQGKKEMGPFKYATPFNNGVAKVFMETEKKYGNYLIDKKNISIAHYYSITDVENHLARFTIYNRTGLADLSGKILSEPLYQRIQYVGDEIFRVDYFDAVGYFRKDGTWILKP